MTDENGVAKNYDLWMMLNNGVDIKERRIYLTGNIEESADVCLSAIDHFNSSKYCPKTYKDPISILINSPGGYIDYMFSLYEAIIHSEAEVHTIASGHVCSASSLILVAGDKRFAYETAWIMFHRLSLDLSGNDNEVIASAEVTKKMATKYWRLLERHTNWSAGKWLNLVKKKGEIWLSAPEMLEKGVIDEVIRPSRRQFEPISSRNLNV